MWRFINLINSVYIWKHIWLHFWKPASVFLLLSRHERMDVRQKQRSWYSPPAAFMNFTGDAGETLARLFLGFPSRARLFLTACLQSIFLSLFLSLLHSLLLSPTFICSPPFIHLYLESGKCRSPPADLGTEACCHLDFKISAKTNWGIYIHTCFLPIFVFYWKYIFLYL